MAEKPFVYFTSDDDKYEWGFYLDPCYIPSVGDEVYLSYGPPDKEAENGCFPRVVSRWVGVGDRDGDGLLWQAWHITVRLDEDNPIPEGCIADSDEWPCSEKSKRDEEHKEWLREFHRKHLTPPLDSE